MIAVRPAVESDRHTIRRLVIAERLDPTMLDWENFIVAEEEGTIVGIAQVKPYRDCREFGSLVVHPAHRRRGIGTMLIEAALARERGEVYLLCAAPLASYYARFGFRAIAPAEAPTTLRRKLRLSRLFALFGVHVVCMRREAQSSAPQSPAIAALSQDGQS